MRRKREKGNKRKRKIGEANPFLTIPSKIIKVSRRFFVSGNVTALSKSISEFSSSFPSPPLFFLSILKKLLRPSGKNSPFFPERTWLARRTIIVSQVNSDISLSAHANIAFHGRNEILRGTFLKAPKLRRKIETARGVQFMRHLRPTSLRHRKKAKEWRGRGGELRRDRTFFNEARKKRAKTDPEPTPSPLLSSLSGQDDSKDLVTSGFEAGQWS